MIYLDHHATTPCDPTVVRAMEPWWTEHFGNPASSQHTWGMRAKAAVGAAGRKLAAAIGAREARELVWTSGATEADNLAILGVARARRAPAHLVTTAVEHRAVLDPVEALEGEGWSVTRVAPGPDGRVSAADVLAALREDTALVSLMAVNNEVGALMPVAEVGTACQERGVLLHVDAAQALGAIPVDVVAWGADLVSLSAHKAYGPKGVGALWVRGGRPGVRLAPLLHGGGHQRGLRSGTLPTPLIVGMGEAARLAAEALDSGEVARVRALRDALQEGLLALGGRVLGPERAHRHPGNLAIAFEGRDAVDLMARLRDVACSTGSACSSESGAPSHVLAAMDLPEATRRGALRFGVGRSNTAEEISRVIERMTEELGRA